LRAIADTIYVLYAADKGRNDVSKLFEPLAVDIKAILFGDPHKQVKTTDEAGQPAIDEGHHHPFMMLDIFGVLVRMFFLELLMAKSRNQKLSTAAYPALVEFFYSGVVAQAILQLTTSHGDTVDEPSLSGQDKSHVLQRLLEGDAEVTSLVDRLTLTFLRKTALFFHAYLDLPSPSDELSPTEKEPSPHHRAAEEHSRLREYLRLPPVSKLLASMRDNNTIALLEGWLRVSSEGATRMEDDDGALAKGHNEFWMLDTGATFELDKRSLPYLYQDMLLFTKPSEAICKRCQTTPKPMALCLLCGELLCFGLGCCKDEKGIGELNQVLFIYLFCF